MNEGADILKGVYYPVHDHGFIALIDYMGADEAIEEMARTSYGKGTRTRTETRGLLRYLMRHRHTSPYEGAELKFHIAMPIFVARQWVRHRTASLNEYSGRYSEMPMTFYEPSEWRLQDATNKQGSEGIVDEHLTSTLELAQWHLLSETQRLYEIALDTEVSRELARIHLPLSQYTQWYWKIDLHNLLHFLTLRTDRHAQQEIRDYANIMADMIRIAFPLVYEAWIDYVVDGTTLSRMELNAIRAFVETRDPLDLILEEASEREQREFEAKLSGGPSVSEEFNLPSPISAKEAEARFFGTRAS